MARVIYVEALDAEELAPYARLTDRRLRNDARYEGGLFIAEGVTVIGHALDAGFEPVSALMPARHINGKAAPLLGRLGDIPVYTAEDDVLRGLTGYEITRGVLCAMRRGAEKTASVVMAGARRIAVLEDIVDPTNVGAIVRSAAALGVDAILLSPRCCDIYHRRAVRVSMGSVFQIPWARLGRDDSDWPEKALRQVKDAGFTLAALALNARSVPLDRFAPPENGRLALTLGCEGFGLRPETVALCDVTVKIPMSRGVDSLNVAAASAVAFWETRVSEK